MPDLGFFGWIIVGFVAGAVAGAFLPSDRRYGCIGTMAVGILGGIIGGWLWVDVLNQPRPQGLLGAIVVAVIGSVIVLALVRGIRRD